MRTCLLCAGLVLLLKGNSHGTTLLGLRLSNVLVGIGLVNLEGCTDVLANIDICNVDRENLERCTSVKTLAEHELRD